MFSSINSIPNKDFYFFYGIPHSPRVITVMTWKGDDNGEGREGRSNNKIIISKITSLKHPKRLKKSFEIK